MRIDCTLLNAGDHNHAVFVLEFCVAELRELIEFNDFERGLGDLASADDATISERLRFLALIAQKVEDAREENGEGSA